jgi:uncharacterized membrane protein SpoIIM required for sporulation
MRKSVKRKIYSTVLTGLIIIGLIGSIFIVIGTHNYIIVSNATQCVEKVKKTYKDDSGLDLLPIEIEKDCNVRWQLNFDEIRVENTWFDSSFALGETEPSIYMILFGFGFWIPAIVLILMRKWFVWLLREEKDQVPVVDK